jgi:hypothetical protein
MKHHKKTLDLSFNKTQIISLRKINIKFQMNTQLKSQIKIQNKIHKNNINCTTKFPLKK